MRKAKVIENTSRIIFMVTAILSIIAVIAIFIFLLIKGAPAFGKIGFFEFIFGSDWVSNSNDVFGKPLVGIYGVLPMIVGSIVATIGALIVGGILGFYTAVYLAKFCPKKIKKPLTSFINLLAGIPSVVFGFFGMKVLLPMFGVFSENGSGSGVLAVSVMLGIMILPTIVAISKSSIDAVPETYYEGAIALGVSHEQAVFKAVVPAARSGIVTAFVLAIGRAIGETMAVVMVAGNSVAYPTGLFSSFRTLTANIVLEMGYAGEVQMSALIATGVVLLAFVIVINLIFKFFMRTRKNEKARKQRDMFWHRWTAKVNFPKVGKIISIITAVISSFTLVAIIGFILINGLPHITWQLLSTNYDYGGHISILPSIVSTLMLVFLCVVISIPIGIMTAIYLHEYTKRGNKTVKIVRSAVDILAGIPSIVYGLFGMIFFCDLLGLGTSIIAGALTVSLMILPTIVRATEESLISVSDTYREGSLALGAGKLRTIFKVVLPAALPGILSAVILSIGRIVSESAPLMFTMGASLKPLPTDGFGSSGTTLAVALYKLAGEGLHVNEAYATACVLIIIVLALNLLAGFVGKRLQRSK